MRVLVTGATGFVGRHVVEALLGLGASVTASGRDLERARAMPWFPRVDFREYDLGLDPARALKTLGRPERMLHLAWAGLPNYRDPAHLQINLPQHQAFLAAMLKGGLKRLVVAGTCLEYGMREGRLREDMEPMPDNPYAQAKNSLRLALEPLAAEAGATLCWARLFYLYGPGQNPRSLLAQLDAAIDRGDSSFDMSGGMQTRDYLPVAEAARRLAILTLQDRVSGVVNCCSGIPVTVIDLVQRRLRERGAFLTLNLGRLPYPDWEPMHFFGDTTRLDAAVKVFEAIQSTTYCQKS